MGEYRQSLTKFVVPLVVFAVLVLIVVIVSFGGSNGGSGSRPDADRQEQTQRAKHRFYTVKQGDSLGAIAEKTGVPVAELQTLNPDVDPRTLIAGQRLKLR